MRQIEAIIFDWGGVLIDDPRPALLQYCAKAFGMPVEDYAEIHDKFLDGFEKGLISEDAFWEKICTELNRPKPERNSLWRDAFRSAYSPRAEMFSLASKLHDAGYKTALLSNTEAPAMRYFHELNYDMFDQLVFSCAQGALKPEKKIYKVTLDKLGTEAQHSVLIDDKVEYINGAREVGLNAILFKSIDQVKNELAQLSIKTD
jgi:epoxide hydrolase-like predicted phosphatase